MQKIRNSFVLLLCLIVCPALWAAPANEAKDDSTESIVLDADDAADMAGDPLKDDIPDAGDKFAQFPLDFVQQKILQRGLKTRALFLKQWEQERATIGDEAIKKRVKKNDFEFNYELGKAELTFIDGKSVIRFVDNESQMSVVFANSGEIEKDSTHLRQYIARQHIDSASKAKTKKRGRNVILSWMEQDRVEWSHYLPRHRLFSPGWWKDWWWASFKVPTKGDLVLGTMCAAAQFGLAACVAGAKSALDPNSHFDLTPATLASIWGFSIGVMASTYRNIVYRGNVFSQTAKSAFVGLSFAYTLMVCTEGSEKLLNITDMSGFLLNLHIWSNTFANRWASTEWGQLTRVRTFERDNTEDMIWKLPVLGEVEMNRASVENQVIYLIPFVLKLGDLTGVTVAIPGLGVIPLGKALLWGSSPAAQYATLKYAEYKNYNMVDQLRKRWTDFKRSPISLLKFLLKSPYLIASAPSTLYRKMTKEATHCAESIAGAPIKLGVEELEH